MKYILNYFRGILMGISDLFPGISGGTIALILGIYPRLISSISSLSDLFPSLFKGKEGVKQIIRKINPSFIIPLILGIGTSIFLGARLTSHLIEAYPVILMSFFFGFLLLSIKIPWAMVDKKNFTSISGFVVGALFAVLFSLITSVSINMNTIFIFISGFVAISFMILPGVSGASALLILGSYSAIISAVADLNFSILFWFGLGIIIGIVLMSKLLHKMMKERPDLTFGILTGLLSGSLVRVWPIRSAVGFAEGLPILSMEILSLPIIISFVLGMTLIFGLEKLGRWLK